MRVAVYHNNRDIRLDERPRPQVGPGELLLSVRASGICGSDVMEWYRVPKAPLVLGHEVAGVVEEIGPDVTRFRPGDRIVATHHIPCLDCRYCKTDRQSVCETLLGTNFEPGGFSELVRLPAPHVERGTFLLPDDVSFAAGSFVEPLACVLRAQRLAGVQEGDAVVVLGSGISGILQIQAARAAGAATIIATDPSKFRRAAALRFGADLALEPEMNVRAELERLVGRLAERVILCTGARPAFDQALELVDRGGVIVFFAPLAPDELLPLPVNRLWRSCVTLLSSYAGPPAEMRQALDMIATGRIDVESMVTHRLPLALTQEGFRLMTEAQEALKVIVEPHN